MAFLASRRLLSFQHREDIAGLYQSTSVTQRVTWHQMWWSNCSGARGTLFLTEKSQWIHVEENRKSPPGHGSNNCGGEAPSKDAKISDSKMRSRTLASSPSIPTNPLPPPPTQTLVTNGEQSLYRGQTWQTHLTRGYHPRSKHTGITPTGEGHNTTRGILPPKMLTANSEETSEKPKVRSTVQKHWSIVFKSVKVMNSREGQRTVTIGGDSVDTHSK